MYCNRAFKELAPDARIPYAPAPYRSRGYRLKVTSEMIGALKASGLTAEQVLTAVEALAGVRSNDAIRKARSRSVVTDNPGQSRTNRDNPDSHNGSPSPLPPLDKETSPIPPKEINPPLTPQPFHRFWGAYPNKVGKSDASKAFDRALKRTSIDVLMAGLERYAAKTDDRPWCNPATWLNQDRWADEPVAVARGSPPNRKPSLADRFKQFGDFLDERQIENGSGLVQPAIEFLPPVSGER